MFRISFIIISGVLISCLTLLAIGFSALGEGSLPDYKWLWWFALWVVGFSLHFKWRKIGYIVMLLPIIFHIILFVIAIIS
ncbi:hypothetical protein [Bacillus suaedaesalsae]|uniref:Cyd operon protein YbgE n=1 Tax=Bacillus suaedaesalsae TaxID=2810349 RepID=A0ABS2DM60_9BACI|nr:hypothetical protein [Bacillus suaedaesalsae]MBM6619437.1 hypothetical protein [Bacillus suaedaesalsae]